MGIFEYQGIKIEWLGHASFKIKFDSKVLYIDPFILPESPEKADLVFITHEHYDHCDVEKIKRISSEDTIIVATEDCIAKLRGLNVFPVVPNREYKVKDVEFKTIPAYNVNKTFHTRPSNWVGYIINVNGVRIYHAGDTDYIPEMDKLENIDIALVPVGGTYTMDYREAAKAVNSFKPKVAIPMHFGSIVGSRKDAEKFKELVEYSKVVIL
ncbi:MAG: MBL fold metallo-hydrolase [Candidatus Aenigmatarchaeota archaeon]|nr:MAG: MBL fold metallo-hydrolase [Candidatus Aenigmarchaeota archaeon]